MLPVSATCTLLVRSGTWKTDTSRTSSGPILYAPLPGVATDVSLSAALDNAVVCSAAGVGAKDPLSCRLLKFEEAPQPPKQAAQIVSMTAHMRCVTAARLHGFDRFVRSSLCFGICTPQQTWQA